MNAVKPTSVAMRVGGGLMCDGDWTTNGHWMIHRDVVDARFTSAQTIAASFNVDCSETNNLERVFESMNRETERVAMVSDWVHFGARDTPKGARLLVDEDGFVLTNEKGEALAINEVYRVLLGLESGDNLRQAGPAGALRDKGGMRVLMPLLLQVGNLPAIRPAEDVAELTPDAALDSVCGDGTASTLRALQAVAS